MPCENVTDRVQYYIEVIIILETTTSSFAAKY